MKGGNGGMKTLERKALDQAQDLMWTAFDTVSKAKRIQLAKQALEISPDCADAYVVLSDDLTFNSRKEKIEFLEEGVRAGFRALEPGTVRESDGWLWGTLEARPYMRARHALALELERDGQTEEAIAHYRELLKINKHDNQGIRYLLAPLLVSLDRLVEAEKLIKKYPDDVGPELNYSHALLLFKRSGDTQKSREILGEAVRWSPHVIPHLLSPKLLKRATGYYVTVGGEDEGYIYAKHWRESWCKTEGAIEWLIEILMDSYRKHNKLFIQTFNRLDK